jgi:2-polyprenyl-3-methyl-5-hydroxy-6-metoxy-1,4-benzoquinol methylase
MTTLEATTRQDIDASPRPRNGRIKHPDRGVNRFNEERIIRRFFRSLDLKPDQKVLDVACGYGRKMKWLREDGVNVEGVDINPHLVDSARESGFVAHTLDEFNRSSEQYDAMLMAHIVEHFSPADLLEFMDGYLDRLKVGGHLVISTPLMWPNFYNDFDHTKPFYPTAFIMVFSQPVSQVQYHSRNRLRLIDMGLRRIPRSQPTVEKLYSSFYLSDPLWKAGHGGMDRVWSLAFRLTGGSVGGMSNGWIGLFEKAA